ncbi:MAG TPA: hypothetical protein VGE74_03350 [Gemmata sp.]
MTRAAALLLVACVAADLVALAVFLGFLWLAHKDVRRRAAEDGAPIGSAARDFQYLLAAVCAALVALAGAAALLFV